MTISVECPNCSSKYAAPAAMAGRRVRCKHCSHVFTIAGDAEAGGSDADFALSPEDQRLDSSAGAPAATGGRASQQAPFDAPEDPEHAFASAFADYVQPRRPNIAYKFPSASSLDRWLPYALVTFGLFCVGIPTVGAAMHGTPAWVGPLRFALFLVLYLAVICPILWLAARMASANAKFDLPPQPRWRISAAFSFSFGFACLLWLTTDSLGGLIPGVISGLAVGLAAMWVLLRILKAEAPVTLGFGGGAFVAGVMACVGILIAVNAVVLQMVKTAKTPTTLAYSPIAPGLNWVQPAEPSVPRSETLPSDAQANATTPDDGTTASSAATTAEATAAATTGPSTRDSVASNDKPSIFSADFHPKADTAPSATGTESAVATRRPVGTDTSVVLSPGATPPNPAGVGNSSEESLVAAIHEARSPWVESVASLTTLAPLTAFSPALTNAPWAILTSSSKQGAGEINDALEVWSLLPQPQRRYQRAQCHPDPDHNYIISPGGETMVRVVRFPTFGAEVWSTSQGALVKVIPFPADHSGAVPTVLGFLNDDRFLIRWQRNLDAMALEIYDAKTGKSLRPIAEARHSHVSGNWAVSPDGRMFAMVAFTADRGQDKPQVVFTNFSEPATGGKLTIPGLDPQWAADPAAIAFSPDSKRLAVLFEHDGNAAIYNWHLSDKKLTGPLLFAADDAATAQHVLPNDAPMGFVEGLPAQLRQMVWVGDLNALLVHGDLLIDSDSGRILTQLGARGVLGAWARGNVCLLLYRASDTLRLAEVRLKKP